MISRRDVLVSVASLGAVGVAPKRLPAATVNPPVFEVPIELQSRRLVVSCLINGSGPFAFGIDTGGFVSAVRLELAEQLKLRERGKSSMGIAGQTDLFPMFEAREVVFGNVLRQEHVLLAGTSDIGFGPGIAGMLAAGSVTTMDSEIDFAAREWRLYPNGGPARDGWDRYERAIELTSRVGSPHLFGSVALGAQTLRCLFDTGAPTPFVLFPRTARKGGIDLEAQSWSPARLNGREAQIFRSKLPLRIGGLTIEQPLVAVQKSFPSFIGDGLVGLPLIQRLNFATDVKQRVLWTRPSGLPAEPERYNRSGLWVDRRGGQLFAGQVGKGSPAERAGIVPGDRIEGIEFQALIQRLNGRSGNEVGFAVARGGAKRDITLTLTNYL